MLLIAMAASLGLPDALDSCGAGPTARPAFDASLLKPGETLNGVSGKAKTVDLPPWIVDQRVDWAAVMTAGLTPHSSVSFAVFDPATGVSTVEANASGLAVMADFPGRGRLARLDYQVCKSGSAEKYSVFSTTKAPLILVRENLRDDEVDMLISDPLHRGRPHTR